jgi:hypothetical protein
MHCGAMVRVRTKDLVIERAIFALGGLAALLTVLHAVSAAVGIPLMVGGWVAAAVYRVWASRLEPCDKD